VHRLHAQQQRPFRCGLQVDRRLRGELTGGGQPVLLLRGGPPGPGLVALVGRDVSDDAGHEQQHRQHGCGPARQPQRAPVLADVLAESKIRQSPPQSGRQRPRRPRPGRRERVRAAFAGVLTG